MIARFQDLNDYSSSPLSLAYDLASDLPTSFPNCLESLVGTLDTLIELAVAVFF